MNPVQHRFDTMDLNLLRVFEAVYRERHLTRAARALALSPSAVSHALGRLRRHLEDPLFEREGTQMAPTATCARMAPALIEQLAQLRRLLHRWGDFDPRSSQLTFRVGMPDAIEPMVLPPIQRALRKAAPQAKLTSLGYSRADLERELAARHMDLAIDVALPVHEPIRHEPILEDEFCVVVRRNFPQRRKLSLAQYAAADHVLVSSRATGLVLEDHALLRLGIERKVVVRGQSYETALRMVAHTDMVLTAPRQLTSELGRGHELSRRALPFGLPRVRLDLYRHRNAEDDPAQAWFRDLVAKSLGPS